MKFIKGMIVLIIVTVMLIGLLPALQTSTNAAATPVLVLRSTTAVNPILDHALDYDTYSTGGPFTVTFEWKAVNIKDNDANDRDAGHAFVNVIGTVNGSTTQEQANPGLTIKGSTNWISESFSFQNVGVYVSSGTSISGCILRFGMWKAKGELSIRNLLIKNASGAVLYNLNADPIVSKAVNNAIAMGMTEFAMSELAVIDYAHCPWNAGQFSSGNYAAAIRIEGNPYPSTTTQKIFSDPPFYISTTTRVTGETTTRRTSSISTAPTTQPITTEPSTQPTTMPTTAPPTIPTNPGNSCQHNFICGICMDCFEMNPDFRHPCLNGHSFDEHGACSNCSIYDPDFFDRCTDGHNLDENGQCKDCSYYEEPVRTESNPENPDDASLDKANDNSIVLVIALSVIGCLLVAGLVAFLVIKKKK